MNKTRLLISASILMMFSTLASSENLQLTQQEQQYLASKPVLSLCVDPDWLPYEKLDAQGQYIGLVAQYMQLIQSRLGVSINPVITSNWAESQKLYEAGQCDLVSALNKTPQRAEFLDFSQPYIQSPAVLVLLDHNTTAKHLADLAGKQLAMVKGYVYESKLREKHPDIRISYVDNMETALKSVSEGKTEATIGPLFLVSASIMKQKLDNLKMVGNTEYQDELRIGVRKGDALLLSAVEKAVASLTSEDNRAVRRSWAAY